MNRTVITVEAAINAPVEKVWKMWTDPAHMINWNFASDDWCAPSAQADLEVGGKFVCRMEAKDGSMGFDFSGQYTAVEVNKRLAYVLDDNREVEIDFISKGNTTIVTEKFEAEGVNTLDLQRSGWQAILNNFKHYVENN